MVLNPQQKCTYMYFIVCLLLIYICIYDYQAYCMHVCKWIIGRSGVFRIHGGVGQLPPLRLSKRKSKIGEKRKNMNEKWRKEENKRKIPLPNILDLLPPNLISEYALDTWNIISVKCSFVNNRWTIETNRQACYYVNQDPPPHSPPPLFFFVFFSSQERHKQK